MPFAPPRWLPSAGAVALVAVAPLAALADTPFAPGGVAALPPHGRVMWDAAGPLLTFAAPGVVLSVWYAAFAAAAAVVLLAAVSVPRAATTPWARRLAWAAWGAFAAVALGTALEATGTALANVGFALYLPTTFLGPLLGAAAGIVALRARALPRGAAWALTLMPGAMALTLVALPQFPAGTGLGVGLAWAAAAAACGPAREAA